PAETAEFLPGFHVPEPYGVVSIRTRQEAAAVRRKGHARDRALVAIEASDGARRFPLFGPGTPFLRFLGLAQALVGLAELEELPPPARAEFHGLLHGADGGLPFAGAGVGRAQQEPPVGATLREQLQAFLGQLDRAAWVARPGIGAVSQAPGQVAEGVVKIL